MYRFKFYNGEVMFTSQPVDPQSPLPAIQPLELSHLVKVVSDEEVEAFMSFGLHRRRYFWQKLMEKYEIREPVFMKDINGDEIHYDVVEWQ